MKTARLLLAVRVLAVVCVSTAVAEAAGTAAASTVVAGMVFCDQCKDGARGLFDYPLYGTYDDPSSLHGHALASPHLTRIKHELNVAWSHG
jgi:hypothetical protein